MLGRRAVGYLCDRPLRVDSCRSRQPYPIAAIVLRAIRARAWTSLLSAIDSATIAPCFTAFLLTFRAPPAAPCIRQTLAPRTAGARYCRPLRFDLAWHLNARCVGQCMRSFSGFFARPYPLGRGVDVPDDRLAALSDVDVLNDHALLAPRSIILQGRHLRRERPRELVERTLCAVLLWDVIDVCEAARERHGNGVANG